MSYVTIVCFQECIDKALSPCTISLINGNTAWCGSLDIKSD